MEIRYLNLRREDFNLAPGLVAEIRGKAKQYMAKGEPRGEIWFEDEEIDLLILNDQEELIEVKKRYEPTAEEWKTIRAKLKDSRDWDIIPHQPDRDPFDYF